MSFNYSCLQQSNKISLTIIIIFSLILQWCSIKTTNDITEYMLIYNEDNLYSGCNLYLKDNKVYTQPREKDYFREVKELANPWRGVKMYEWEGIDEPSLKVVFQDTTKIQSLIAPYFSLHHCYYKDRNYVYGELDNNWFPLFSGFDYDTLEVMTGIQTLFNGDKILTTCQWGGCFKDKNATYYSSGWGENANFFILDFIRNPDKVLPPDSNYDPFKI